MRRSFRARPAGGLLVGLVAWAGLAGAGPAAPAVDAAPAAHAPTTAAAPPSGGPDVEAITRQFNRAARVVALWYQKTPPADRMTWGGLGAAAALALGVVFERSAKLRRRRILPGDFQSRFLERLQDGRLDRGKALDFCELNASPASRVALAAVKRWGRPTVDLERAAGLAQRIEAERLRRHIGTLRRLAALTPLIGLLGTLTTLSRSLSALNAEANAAVWGPAVAAALWPLTAGVALATLALVAYDGLAGKAEQLSDALDRVAAETIDAIALALPLSPPTVPAAPSTVSRPSGGSTGSARTPHQIRMEIPKPSPRIQPDLDDDDY